MLQRISSPLTLTCSQSLQVLIRCLKVLESTNLNPLFKIELPSLIAFFAIVFTLGIAFSLRLKVSILVRLFKSLQGNDASPIYLLDFIHAFNFACI